MVYIVLLLQTVVLIWNTEPVLGASTTTVSGNTTTPAITTAPTTVSTAVSTTVSTTTISSTTSINSSLACYDCSETFKSVWEPYTTCQYYPTRAPLRSCLDVERYCKVEQVSYRDLTVSITRGCTDSCYHGCYAFGFGLTRLKCTSCCRSAGCNVGSMASRHTVLDYRTLTGSFVLFFYIVFYYTVR